MKPHSDQDIEDTAKTLRKTARQKAGLALDWEKASLDMQDWYRKKAVEILDGRTWHE
jgi:hypothetical protein